MKTINIDDFDSLCSNHLCKIAQLFLMKNKQYANQDDVLTATLPDAKERLYDVVVYCLLGLAILSDKDEELQGC